MREISSDELLAVSGAYMEVDDNRRASLAIGTNIGNFIHGMNSWESRVGGLLGPVGALVGGYIHFARAH